MHSETFFDEVVKIAQSIDAAGVENLATELAALRQRGGRLFFVGLGGSAANCSHSVNDFRKLCGIEAYTPVDNVAELTARANDEGLNCIFEGWLYVGNPTEKDALLVLSVGGGTKEVSVSLC